MHYHDGDPGRGCVFGLLLSCCIWALAAMAVLLT
jgi:hypothetical protein